MTGRTGAADQTSDAIRISFTTSQAEQAAATRAILRARPNWYAVSALFGLVPTVLAVRTGLTEGVNSEVVVLGLVAAIGLVFWNYGVPWIAVRSARRGVPNPDGPFTWTIDDRGCRLEGPGLDANLDWTRIVDAKETAESFLLYVGAMQAYAIPKRAVAAEDLSRLRDRLARRHRAAAA